jgi:hypothetical protein
VLGCASPFGFSLPFFVWLPRAQCSNCRTHFSLLLECPLWFSFTGHSVCSRSSAAARSSRRFSSQGEVAHLVLPVPARRAREVLLIFAPPRLLFLRAYVLVLAQSTGRSHVSSLFSLLVKPIGVRAAPDLSPNQSGFHGPVPVQHIRSSPGWICA